MGISKSSDECLVFLISFFLICKHSKANNTNALDDPKCVPHILTSMPNLVITLQRCLTEFSHVNTSTRRIGIQWRCIVMYHTVSMHQKAKTSPSTFAVLEEHLRHVSSISRPKFYESNYVRALYKWRIKWK